MVSPDNGSVTEKESWHLNRDGAQYGPYDLAYLMQLIREGSVLPRDLVWSPALGAWPVTWKICSLNKKRCI